MIQRIRLLVIPALFAVMAAAQLTRGFVSGTISDASGAVVPGVTIMLTGRSTGVRYESVTNEAGVYRLAAVEPGDYGTEFSKPGFDTVRENIALESAQEVVLNPVLVVAGSTAAINVDASAIGIALSKASPVIERRFDRETIEALPMTGFREVNDLAALAPTVNGVNAFVSSNGQRTSQNLFTIDGVDNIDPQYSFITIGISPEGVSEFSVRTNSFSAEYGRSLGAQVSVITRSGTNQAHGQIWEYYDANWLSAATLANKRAGIEESRYIDHQAGASFGGPIRRNKTFIFGLFQALPHREGVSANGIASVTFPTPAGLEALKTVPLAPGQTVESRQAALASLSFLPDLQREAKRYDRITRTPINGVPVEFGSTAVGIATPGDYYRVQARLDHSFSDRDKLSYFGSALTGEAPIARSWAFTNNTLGDRFSSSESWLSQTHSASETHIFGPSLVNEARLSFSRRQTELLPRNDAGVRAVINSYFTMGPDASAPFIRPSNTYEAQEVLTWTHGRHSLKFGAHFVELQDTLTGTRQSQWTFPSFAALINNQATSLLVRLKTSSLSLRSLKQNYFVQDDFKIRPDLTLNIGVRYQRADVPHGLFGAATPSIAAAGVPGDVRPDTNDVAPRFGFAYSPKGGLFGSGNTVFRGGIGMTYGLAYEGSVNSLIELTNNYPYNLQVTLPANQLVNRFPTVPTVSAPGFTPAANFTNFPADAKNSTTLFQMFSIQRQIAQDYFVEAGYSGARSQHLYRRIETNISPLTAQQAAQVIATGNAIPTVQQRALHPQWGSRLLLDTGSYNVFHAGYVKFDRRMAHGFLLGASYTYCSNLGYADGSIRPQDSRDYHSEYARLPNERPHRFVAHYVWRTPGKRLWSGWRISGIALMQSGNPFTITTGTDSNGDGVTSDRPDYNPAGALQLDPVTGDWRSFTTPLAGGRFVTPLSPAGRPLQFSMPYGGNLGRNTYRAPSYARHDLSVMKPFRVTERVELELRADWRNVLNHRNFTAPVAAMSNLNFGANTSSPASRTTMLSAKVRF